MNKIIFDVTDLRSYISRFAHLSGIQRVMVMMIDEVAAQTGAERIWLGYSSAGGQGYQIRPYAGLGKGGMSDIPALAQLLDQSATAPTRPSLERYADQPVKRAFHTMIRDRKAARGDAAYFAKRGTSIEAWRASAPRAKTQAASQAAPNALEVCGAGDWVVMLDAGWADPSWQREDNALKRLRKRGVQNAVLVHDLIQIQNPEYIHGSDPMVFYRWLHSTLATTDLYLANSKATAKDLQAFLDAHTAQQPVHVLPLAQEALKPPAAQPESHPAGVNLPKIPDTYARLDQTWDMNSEVRALLKWPYVLCVGTMDIRKNLWALAQVWQRLGQNREITLPKLVFVGRPGSFNEDFNRLMQATGNLGGWVEIFTDASDRELDFLYRNCLFTAMVSFYEGWGLPIGESLSYGKTGVVSERSSMPEVGGGLVEYCDPYDMNSIEEACLKLIAAPALREALEARIAATTLRSWADVSRDFLKQLYT